MLETKLNAQGAEVVEDVEFVDDEEYDAVVNAYVSDQEPELPEEIMMEAEREKHERKLADARRCLVEDAVLLRGIAEDIEDGHVDELDDPAEDAATLHRMADALDVLAQNAPRVPADAPQPAPFPVLN